MCFGSKMSDVVVYYMFLQIEVAPQADDTSVHGTNPLALLPTTTQTALYLDIHAKGNV